MSILINNMSWWQNKKSPLIFLLSFGLLFSLLSGGTIYAQGEGEGESGGDPIGARQQEDLSQTEEEASHLSDLHRRDREACAAEAGGGPGGGGSSGGGLPGGSGPGGGGNNLTVGGEQETRAALAAAGWIVNNDNNCGGLTYQQHRAQTGQRCTSVAGLPQYSVDRLGQLQAEVERSSGYTGPLILTGGTEAGHSTHGAGNNIVDLQRNNEVLNTYIIRNADSTTINHRNERVYILDGDHYTDEGDHWHVDFRSANQSGNQASLKTGGGTWAEWWPEIKTVFWPAIAQAISVGSLVDFGGTLVNVNTASSDQINQMVAGMDDISLNQLFTGSSATAINGILPRLDFDTLNRTIGRLNDNSLNRVMSTVTNDTFSQVSGLLIEDSFGEIFSGLNRSTVNTVINGFSSGNLSTIFSLTDNGVVADVLGGLTGGSTNNLLSQLSQGAVNNIFSGLGSSQINQLISGLGTPALNNVFTMVGGSTLNTVLDSLSGGVMESILPALGATGLTNMFTNSLPGVLDGALGSVSPEILTPVLNSLPEGVLSSVANVSAVSAVLGNVPGLGGLAGLTGLGTGLYVPVVEQNGQLMQHTESIDTTTQEVRDLSVQICTYLKQIARIQASFETSRAEDANVSRIASTEIEKYRTALFDLIKRGYVDNTGTADSGPLFVVNTRIYWQESALEGENLARLAIKDSTNPDKNEILNTLNNSGLSINPTITPEQIQALQRRPTNTQNQSVARALDNIPILSSLVIEPIKRTLAFVSGGRLMAQGQNPTPAASNVNAKDYWEAWNLLIEPRNNRFGSYLIAQDLVNAKRQEAVEIAKHETLAAQGFLPIRTCAEGQWVGSGEPGDPKVCRVWQTNTPGILIKDSGAAGLNSRLAQYEQADGMGDIVRGDEPNPREIIELKPTPGGGGAPGPGLVQPGQITQTGETLRSEAGPSGSTGGTSPGGAGTGAGTGNTNNNLGGMDWSSLTNLVDGFFNQDDEPDESNSDLLQGIIAYLTQVAANQEPLVNFKKKDRSSDEILLYWFAPNATTCVSGNAWLNNEEEVVRAAGVSLTQRGSVRLAPPTEGATYEITCTNNNGSIEREITIPAQTP